MSRPLDKENPASIRVSHDRVGENTFVFVLTDPLSYRNEIVLSEEALENLIRYRNSLKGE